MSICLEIKVWNGTQSNRIATFQVIIITDGDITWVYHHLYIYLGENISIFLIKTLDEKILTEIKKNSLIFHSKDEKVRAALRGVRELGKLVML